MVRLQIGVLAFVLGVASAGAQEKRTSEIPFAISAAKAADAVFRNLILRRLQAHSRGDAAGYRKLLADDFVHVDDTGKRRTLSEMGAYHGAGGRSRWEMSTFHARRLADSLVIADCEVTEFVPLGPRELRMPLHETDVFVLRGGRWLFLQHAETHVASNPKQAEPNAMTLDEYVGRYEWWPGYAETFTRKGNQLFVQTTGDDSLTLLHAASDESFFSQGDPSLVVFVRDATGKVTREIAHFPDGQVLIGNKVHN